MPLEHFEQAVESYSDSVNVVMDYVASKPESKKRIYDRYFRELTDAALKLMSHASNEKWEVSYEIVKEAYFRLHDAFGLKRPGKIVLLSKKSEAGPAPVNSARSSSSRHNAFTYGQQARHGSRFMDPREQHQASGDLGRHVVHPALYSSSASASSAQAPFSHFGMPARSPHPGAGQEQVRGPVIRAPGGPQNGIRLADVDPRRPLRPQVQDSAYAKLATMMHSVDSAAYAVAKQMGGSDAEIINNYFEVLGDAPGRQDLSPSANVQTPYQPGNMQANPAPRPRRTMIGGVLECIGCGRGK